MAFYCGDYFIKWFILNLLCICVGWKAGISIQRLKKHFSGSQKIMIKNKAFAPNKTNTHTKSLKSPYLKGITYFFVPFLLCLYLYSLYILIIVKTVYFLCQWFKSFFVFNSNYNFINFCAQENVKKMLKKC